MDFHIQDNGIPFTVELHKNECCLAQTAQYLCHICPQAAGTKRIWSVMDGNHTKKRNRLTQEKVKLMTTMQMNIQQDRKRQAIQNAASENRRALRLNARLRQEQSDEAETVEESSSDIPPEFVDQLADFDEGEIINSIMPYCGLDPDCSEEINLESSQHELVTLRDLADV